MPPPDMKNGGVGAITPEHRRNEKTATAKEALSSATVQSRADDRKQHQQHQQLPIVLAATAYPPAWGTVTTLIVLDQECLCGDWHNHRVKAPAPALLQRKARCGSKYELALHPPRASKRKRAA